MPKHCRKKVIEAVESKEKSKGEIAKKIDIPGLKEQTKTAIYIEEISKRVMNNTRRVSIFLGYKSQSSFAPLGPS